MDLTVNVLNVDVNTAPYYINLPESVSVNEDVTAAADIFDVDATDDDGDTLTYSLSDVSPTTSVFAINSGSKYHVSVCGLCSSLFNPKIKLFVLTTGFCQLSSLHILRYQLSSDFLNVIPYSWCCHLSSDWLLLSLQLVLLIIK